MGNSVDEGFVSLKRPPLKDLVAVCLINRHCGLPCRAPIFCGLTDRFFLIPRVSIRARFFVQFILESQLPMWGDEKDAIRE